LKTQVVTPPAASGRAEPKKNWHVPPPAAHGVLSVHWIDVSFVHRWFWCWFGWVFGIGPEMSQRLGHCGRIVVPVPVQFKTFTVTAPLLMIGAR
jgi:hypothetical protein